jgi:hypothetical protein
MVLKEEKNGKSFKKAFEDYGHKLYMLTKGGRDPATL